jgi:hypothetical protein
MIHTVLGRKILNIYAKMFEKEEVGEKMLCNKMTRHI